MMELRIEYYKEDETLVVAAVWRSAVACLEGCTRGIVHVSMHVDVFLLCSCFIGDHLLLDQPFWCVLAEFVDVGDGQRRPPGSTGQSCKKCEQSRSLSLIVPGDKGISL